ncbi:MAG: hypothetical protein WCV72_02130 [Patescibacteria group bacterium]|jgi:hypothetical protein
MSLESLNPIDDESGGSKATEISDEVFREQIRKTQKAQKALKKAEGKARAKDDRLAKVIGKFLQTRSNTAAMILISRCLDHNIPAGLILGILALVEVEAQKEFEVVLGENAQILIAPKVGERTLVAHTDFPPEVKNALDVWSFGLLEFGLTQPARLLATAVSPEGELFPSLVKLTTFVTRDFLVERKIELEFTRIEQFADFILKSVLLKIKNQIEATKSLGGGEF